MKIIQLQVGHLGTNCYIVYCKKTLNAAVIDPGGNAEEINAIINRENLQLKYIINTHGHADHIAANDKIKQAGAKLLIHSADANMLASAQANLSAFIGNNIVSQAADGLLKDNDIISLGNIEFKVLHTPGHTPGGICLSTTGVVFSGDTLFAQSVGRTDFPGGSHSALINSIKNQLMPLADDTKVLPGHGPATTIGDERLMNPFIQ